MGPEAPAWQGCALDACSLAFCALNELLVLFAAAGVFAIKLDTRGSEAVSLCEGLAVDGVTGDVRCGSLICALD